MLLVLLAVLAASALFIGPLWWRRFRRRLDAAHAAEPLIVTRKDHLSLCCAADDLLCKILGIALVAFGAIVALLGALDLHNRDTQRQLADRDAHQHDRMGRAIDNLNSPGTTSRLFGVLSLRRLGTSDPNYRGDCLRLLSAYLRDRRPIRDASGARVPSRTLADDEASAVRALCDVARDASESERQLIDLSRADLSTADFSGCSLTGASFQRAILDGTKFQGTDLTRADLRYATGTTPGFSGATLRGSKFDGAELAGAAFPGAVMTGATFCGPRHVMLTDAAKTLAFQAPDILVSTAVLRQAALDGAIGLTDAQLADVCFDNTTTVPPHLAAAAVRKLVEMADFCDLVAARHGTARLSPESPAPSTTAPQ